MSNILINSYDYKNLVRRLRENNSCDVIAIVSDEQAYIAEFVHHYLYLGFANFYLGINNSNDQTAITISKLSEKYVNIFLIDVDNQFLTGRQEACYQYLFNIARCSSHSSHALFVDVDEFWVAEPFPRKVQNFMQDKKTLTAFLFDGLIALTKNHFHLHSHPAKEK